jgi:hypothetical protein
MCNDMMHYAATVKNKMQIISLSQCVLFTYLSVSQKIERDLHVLEHVEPQAASLAGLQ